jgi:hypothetical protein
VVAPTKVICEIDDAHIGHPPELGRAMNRFMVLTAKISKEIIAKLLNLSKFI